MKSYRKLIVCGGSLVLAFVLALLGKLTPEYATVASIACGSFCGANVFEHKAK